MGRRERAGTWHSAAAAFHARYIAAAVADEIGHAHARSCRTKEAVKERRSKLPVASMLVVLAALIPAASYACGACVEDKVAATYDY